MPETRGFVPVPDPTKLTTDAVALAKADIEKLFDVKLTALSALHDEKFSGVDTKFAMRDMALDAAFKAAEARVKQQNESNTIAIDKAGAAFTKQIDGLDEKISDLKERVADIARKNWSVVGAYIVGAVGVSSLVAAAIMTALTKQ